MKSAHRHELETNALAHRLELYIMRYRPYASRIVGALIAVIAAVFLWSYISGTSAARRSEAWDSFNQAVAAMPPNLDEIHRSAQEYPGTKMQQMADVTWADAQVWMASRNYLNNRKAAMDALDKAMSTYQGVLQSSKDERLTSQAQLGLARIYEMQDHLDKARQAYRDVTGPYAELAKQQAERLEKPDAQQAYAWLATAEPPRPKPPVGPGTPGQRPDFSPGELGLPTAPGAATGKSEEDSKATAEAFENLFKATQQETKGKETPDRYQPAQPPAKDATPKAPTGTPPVTPPPAAKDGNKPADASPKTGTPAK